MKTVKIMAVILPCILFSIPLIADDVVVSPAKESRDLLKFQADERRRFYDDMLADRQALLKETSAQQNEILERQRKDRREFHPENHTIEERREFFTKQREEMTKFKVEEKEELQKLKAEQKKRREDFHALQKSERREAFDRLKGSLMPSSAPPKAKE